MRGLYNEVKSELRCGKVDVRRQVEGRVKLLHGADGGGERYQAMGVRVNDAGDL